MANPVIKAELREKAGKGSSRALRRAGRIPAVIYGNKKEPVTISLDRIALVKELNTGGFLNTTYDIEVGGKKEMVLPRDVQFHPVTDWPLHVDFLRLAEDATIEVMIPVHFLNEEDCPGLRAGGVLNVVRHEVELSCPANAIPESIEIDIAKLELGESVHISHVKLPEGVTPVITDRDFTIATIAAPSGLKSAEAEAEKAEAEVEEEGETEENNE